MCLLAAAGCSDGSTRPDERTGEQSDRINNGTTDDAGLFAAVGQWSRACTVYLVRVPGLDTRQVVASASHCIAAQVRGCETHTYRQPAQPVDPPTTGWHVRFPEVGSHDPDFRPNCADPIGSTPGTDCYGVDSFVWHPDTVPADYWHCCDGDPASCSVCDPHRDGLPPMDMVLLHLDRPIRQDIYDERMGILLRLGPESPAEGTYEVDPLSWPAEQPIVHVVGRGNSDLIGGGTSVRVWGETRVRSMDYAASRELYCDGTERRVRCSGCVAVTDSNDDDTADGGPWDQNGDSGGPLVVNYTDIGADPIDGLPADSPFSVGVLTGVRYAATWDSTYRIRISQSPDIYVRAPTNSGTFILKHLQDWDQDAVWNHNDNCPVAYNPSQDNCNENAEIRWGYPERGDACDPIPCANAVLTEPTVQIVQEIDTPFFHQVAGRAIRDRFFMTPHGSNAVGNGAHPQRPVSQAMVEDVPAHYRFCQKDATHLIHCGQAAIDDAFLSQVPQIGGPPTPDAPYLPAHLTADIDQPNPAAHTVEPFNHPLIADLGPTESVGLLRQWLYRDDFTSWLSKGWINDNSSSSPLYGWGTNLDGRVWIHSETERGRYPNTPSWPDHYVERPDLSGVGTGYRVKHDGTADGDRLANHYAFLKPDEAVGYTQGKPVPEYWFEWMAWPGGPILPEDWQGTLREDSYLVALQGGSFGVLGRDGRALVVDELLGDHLQSLLADPDIVWASAAEPRLNAGPAGEHAGFHALAIAPDGTDVLDGALRLGNLIGTTVDFERPPVGRPGSPSGRTDFVTVFSRSEDAVFVLGGRDLGTDEQLHDLWMRPVSGPGEWTEIDLGGGYEPDRVLAATWSFGDHRLWVLDEHHGGAGDPHDHPGKVVLCHTSAGPGDARTITVGAAAAQAHLAHGDTLGSCSGDGGKGKRSVRLVRIDPYLGMAELVAEWPRGNRYHDHWLVVDVDGQVLLISSSRSKKEHAVARLEAVAFDSLAPVEVRLLEVRPGRLAFPPQVDLDGYTFVYQRGSKLEVERRSSLGGSAVSLIDLGAIL